MRDVLRNTDFKKGYTPTSFIGEHYPEGFSGGQLTEVERRELVVIGREIGRRRGVVTGLPPLALDDGITGRRGGRSCVLFGGIVW